MLLIAKIMILFQKVMLFSNFLYIFACKMTETGKMMLENW